MRRFLLLLLFFSIGCQREHHHELLYQHPYPNLPEAAVVIGDSLNECALSALELPFGLVVAGYTESIGPGSRDGLLVLVDSLGRPVWARVLYGEGDDVFCSIAEAPGGFAVAGWTYSTSKENSDALIALFDSSGNPIWVRVIPGPQDEAFRAIASAREGFVLAGLSRGSSESCVLLARADSDGQILWAKTVSFGESSEAKALAVMPGGELAVAGIMGDYSNVDIDCLVMLLDSSGDIIWTNSLGDKGLRAFDQALSVAPGPRGSVAVAGYTNGFSSDSSDALVFSLDAAGNLLWAKALGGDDDDRFTSILAVPGGFALGGHTFSYGLRRCQATLSLIDSSGNHLRTRTAGWAGGDWCYALAGGGKGFALAGRTWSFGAGGYDLLVLRLSDGDTRNPTLRERQPSVRDVEAELREVYPDVKSAELASVASRIRVLKVGLRPLATPAPSPSSPRQGS